MGNPEENELNDLKQENASSNEEVISIIEWQSSRKRFWFKTIAAILVFTFLFQELFCYTEFDMLNIFHFLNTTESFGRMSL